MLTARAGRVVTTDELVDGIWGDDPPTAVLSSIHTYISTSADRHRSADRTTWVRLSARGRPCSDRCQCLRRRVGNRVDKDLVANPTAASRRAAAGAGIVEGPCLCRRRRLPRAGRTKRADSPIYGCQRSRSRIEADLALGRHAAVVGELEALAAEYPFRESLRAKHMLALYRDGRQADALRAYRRTQDYLREELGIDPSPELAELEERILNHDYTLIHSREVVSEQVALLFTDIVDSTLLWETNPAAMQAALARHDHLIQSAIEAAGGTVVKGLGDGFIAAFSEPSLAARAAVAAQQAIIASDWSPLEFRCEWRSTPARWSDVAATCSDRR